MDNENIQHIIFKYACNLLARKRYTAAELQKKLQQKFPLEIKEIEKILPRLKERHYLDDAEYARLFIESRLKKKPQSVKMLQMNLRKTGVDHDIIDSALSGSNINEPEIALLTAQKKQKSLAHLPPAKQKEKLYRFLLSRGFSPSIIFQLPFYKNHEQW